MAVKSRCTINVMQLWGVVANGRYFDRATLDSLDRARLSDGILGAEGRLK